MIKTIITSEGGWVLTSIVEEYTGTGIAELSFNGRFVASSEDTFTLIKKCSVEIAKTLRKKLVLLEIQNSGGVKSLQNNIDAFQKKYDSYVFNFYDTETVEAFKEMGVYLIPEG